MNNLESSQNTKWPWGNRKNSLNQVKVLGEKSLSAEQFIDRYKMYPLGNWMGGLMALL